MIAKHLPAAVALVLLGPTGTVWAQNATPPRVANATSVEGTAYVTRADGRQGILARGTVLGVGDTLRARVGAREEALRVAAIVGNDFINQAWISVRTLERL